MSNLVRTISHVCFFILLSALVSFLWWIVFAENYLSSSSPVGGDYFNALTYVNFFSQHLPLPPEGWVPFWYEGTAVVGGYPWLFFYLVQPLTGFFEVASAMEVASAVSLLIFFLASLLLFFQVSKNWLIALALTLIVATTQASYYPLTVGGLITSATAQWYLPLILFLIYRFSETKNARYLVISAIFAGLSLIHNAGIAVLTILAPSFLTLFCLTLFEKQRDKKLWSLLAFTGITIAVGIMGLYNLILQTFFGAASKCNSLQCWGDYPTHLIRWMTPMPLYLILGFGLILLILKIFKKNISFSFLLPASAAFLILLTYAVAAKLKLINGLAIAIFPVRTFWAVNLLLLLITASIFYLVNKTSPILSKIMAIAVFVGVFLLVLTRPVNIKTDFTNTVPVDVGNYIIPKYQTRPISELIAGFFPKTEINWRVDILNAGIYQWWNLVFEKPATRGYSNYPTGIQRDWVYFFQTATRGIPQNTDLELTKNRVLFLLDAYGVNLIENSMSSYPPAILDDKNLITNHVKLREQDFYRLSQNLTTPIVSPTNTQPLLFIGDDAAYNNTIRTISMINLNSKVLIPVKGPNSLSAISDKDLSTFPILFLYQYSGSDFNKLTNYVKNGGRLYIETTSEKSYPKGKLPEIFPIESINLEQVQGGVDLKVVKTEALENVSLQNFSQFSYQGGKWKIFFSNENSIRSSAKPILLINNKPVVVVGSLGKGHVIWSGLNLPFHIVENNNFEEAKFFKNIILNLVSVSSSNGQVEFQVKRQRPEIIEVEGKNYTGIYFKENYHPGWKAQIGEKNLKIYKAGLGFMYIPTGTDETNNSEVFMTFSGSLTIWALFWLTIISLFLSLLYLAIPQLFRLLFKRLSYIFHLKIKGKFTRWVEEE